MVFKAFRPFFPTIEKTASFYALYLVHNALVYALSNLSDYKGSGKLWADSLMARMAEPQFSTYDLTDMNQVYRVTDMLLKDPYKRMLDSLERIANSQTEEQED